MSCFNAEIVPTCKTKILVATDYSDVREATFNDRSLVFVGSIVNYNGLYVLPRRDCLKECTRILETIVINGDNR